MNVMNSDRNLFNILSRSLLKRLAVTALSLGSFVLASCGDLIDSPEDNSQDQTVTDVRSYYYKLQTPGAQYQYTTISPDSVKLHMTMLGQDDEYPLFRNAQVYECEWEYSNDPDNRLEYYYAVSDSEAYSLGYEAEPNSPYQLDLKAPLKKDASWTFPNLDHQTTVATVKRLGFQMKVENTVYPDVIEVEYANQVDSSVTTKYFAHDIGLIYMRRVDKTGQEKFSTYILKKW